MEVELYINKSVEENASIYYEKAKRAKKKLEGARKAIERFSAEIDKINQEKKPEELPQDKERRKMFWFEKFRWFITSTGYLVIGGRDATTNEVIIKKYTLPDEWVFHTDQAGSPFFVIKKKEGEYAIDNNTIREVADATCSFSRAWKNGMSTTSVFYVKPGQITKEANSGEYLTKGAFVIRGKVNYIDNSINLAVGMIQAGEYKGLIMCAPLESIQAHCSSVTRLRQGNDKPSDAAKALRKSFNNLPEVDEIIRALPPGNLEIIKERQRKSQA